MNVEAEGKARTTAAQRASDASTGSGSSSTTTLSGPRLSGVGYRLPAARPIPLSVAAALIAQGTPSVTRRLDAGTCRRPTGLSRAWVAREMVVCHCKAVSDRTVDAAIASGASTVPEITARCTAGGGCGGCHRLLEASARGDPAHEEREPAAASAA